MSQAIGTCYIYLAFIHVQLIASRDQSCIRGIYRKFQIPPTPAIRVHVPCICLSIVSSTNQPDSHRLTHSATCLATRAISLIPPSIPRRTGLKITEPQPPRLPIDAGSRAPARSPTALGPLPRGSGWRMASVLGGFAPRHRRGRHRSWRSGAMIVRSCPWSGLRLRLGSDLLRVLHLLRIELRIEVQTMRVGGTVTVRSLIWWNGNARRVGSTVFVASCTAAGRVTGGGVRRVCELATSSRRAVRNVRWGAVSGCWGTKLSGCQGVTVVERLTKSLRWRVVLEDMDVHVFVWLAYTTIRLACSAVSLISPSVWLPKPHQAEGSRRSICVGVSWETVASYASSCTWPRARARTRARTKSLFLWIAGSSNVSHITRHCAVG